MSPWLSSEHRSKACTSSALGPAASGAAGASAGAMIGVAGSSMAAWLTARSWWTELRSSGARP
eukprot:6711858-Lingulodinium_polyedra.AAC.1